MISSSLWCPAARPSGTKGYPSEARLTDCLCIRLPPAASPDFPRLLQLVYVLLQAARSLLIHAHRDPVLFARSPCLQSCPSRAIPLSASRMTTLQIKSGHCLSASMAPSSVRGPC